MSLFGLAWLAGILTVLSPCILPILPILLGRSLVCHPCGPLALVAGLATSFAVMGSLLAVSAEWLGSLSHLIRQAAILGFVLLGLAAALPRVSQPILERVVPRGWRQPMAGATLWQEFGIGMQMGIVWIPCAGPVLGSILTLVVVEQAVAKGFGALWLYGLGAGIPMLLIAYGGRGLSQRLSTIYPYLARLQQVGGVGIALTGLAILCGWDVALQWRLADWFPPLPL
ncbi:MAG: cytochrome c biogenesis CcdA family protein [Cyanobacteriota bacterium]|nr:cytochrome c biogenesis CcdA family protein [Cyanobacteriota bacterium]